jgi:hypothetical protein
VPLPVKQIADHDLTGVRSHCPAFAIDTIGVTSLTDIRWLFARLTFTILWAKMRARKTRDTPTMV